MIEASWQYFTWEGTRGAIDVLPLGTVERDCEKNGERIYQLADLDELLAEIRDAGMRPGK